jgi:hypothetical protein
MQILSLARDDAFVDVTRAHARRARRDAVETDEHVCPPPRARSGVDSGRTRVRARMEPACAATREVST